MPGFSVFGETVGLRGSTEVCGSGLAILLCSFLSIAALLACSASSATRGGLGAGSPTCSSSSFGEDAVKVSLAGSYIIGFVGVAK